MLEDIALRLLQARFVPDGEAEAHVRRAAYRHPPRDRRIQDPELSVFLRQAPRLVIKVSLSTAA
jgi:hypothetical protein